MYFWPDLLITEPRAYMSQVRHEGGIVLLNYLFHGAIPVLSFQRFIRRAAQGDKITEVLAFAFHSYRCYRVEVANRNHHWILSPHRGAHDGGLFVGIARHVQEFAAYVRVRQSSRHLHTSRRRSGAAPPLPSERLRCGGRAALHLSA